MRDQELLHSPSRRTQSEVELKTDLRSTDLSTGNRIKSFRDTKDLSWHLWYMNIYIEELAREYNLPSHPDKIVLEK